MFRKMMREKQALSREECAEILRNEKRGVLSLLGDDGYPYGLPINHYYSEQDGCLYFHSGRAGHKIDAMRGCEKASFCVYTPGEKRGGNWWLTIRSVIVFGRIREITDHARAIEISRELSRKFTDDEDYIEQEVRSSGAGVLCFALEIEAMTGKTVEER
ncbi:MAG: pyridoxamine 5'-phosphate oxidase family protein [Clostridia bacterium]|nr:pyridoxamine 5'-phosphate oxidase family protein [Clostridia bacterium]